MFSLLRCLLLLSPSNFVACAVEFQVGVLAPEDFSVSNLPLRGLTIRRSCVCCSVCMKNGLRFTDSKHCCADYEKTAFHEYFGHWWEFEIAFSRILNKGLNELQKLWTKILLVVYVGSLGKISRFCYLILPNSFAILNFCAAGDIEENGQGKPR